MKAHWRKCPNRHISGTFQIGKADCYTNRIYRTDCPTCKGTGKVKVRKAKKK